MSTDSIGSPTQPTQEIIPSYLYFQYSDDPDLQAFVASFNSITQGYLDFFNSTPLGVYTNPNVSGQLLDWIANGIYGIERPVFASSVTKYIAGINSKPINASAINGKLYFQSGTATIANDDYYRRVLTWWLYLGLSRTFNIPLLRMRVARFLYAPDGGDVTLSQCQTIHITSGSLPLPPAPTLASSAGGTLPLRQYGARIAYRTPIGSGLAGPAAALTVAANNVLVVDSPAAIPGVTAYDVYADVLSTNPTHFAAGINAMATNGFAVNGTNHLPVAPMTKQNLAPIPIGTNWIEPTSGLIAGSALPSSDNSNTPQNLIITVPSSAGTAATLFQQAMNQAILAFPFQLTASVIIN